MRLPAALALLSLAACGFQLRGQGALPPSMQATHLSVPADAAGLGRELERLLRLNNIAVTGPDAAGALLEIQAARMNRSILSVGPTARAREFALEYTVTFRLTRPSGENIQPSRTLSLRRDYTFDENQVLGTTAEEELLRDELVRQMAGRILGALGG